MDANPSRVLLRIGRDGGRRGLEGTRGLKKERFSKPSLSTSKANSCKS